MNDELAYEIVVSELREQGPKPGLWAKAFAESSGNEAAARAMYMRLRAAQVLEEWQRLEEQKMREAEKWAEIARRSQKFEDFDERAYYTEYSWIGWGVLGFIVVGSVWAFF